MKPSLVAAKAEAILKAYRRVRKPVPAYPNASKAERNQQWTPPPEHMFKINVDAAVNIKNQRAAFRAVIRDFRGNIVAAGINQAQLRGNVSWAKAEAIQWGIKVARDVGLNSVIVEIDCLEVAELINNTKGSRIEIFWTILGIGNQMRNFQKITVQHVLRSCKACAHSLAKFALGNNTPAVWLNLIPAEVQAVLNVL